ncbi:unnamed protein product [Soboliphyme baturini]|uniref:Uncharacterized protein n=1 Tax=Soboliphyme baturini TaxID=241478 RepID=A0A183IES4_9BILA|nr:unnamed protein product [Soboliphyme baturini]
MMQFNFFKRELQNRKNAVFDFNSCLREVFAHKMGQDDGAMIGGPQLILKIEESSLPGAKTTSPESFHSSRFLVEYAKKRRNFLVPSADRNAEDWR